MAPLRLVCFVVAILVLAACGGSRPQTPQKHYPLTGKIISIDQKAHTAMVDAAAIPNFMDAMKMDYPIAADTDINSIRAGENITATVNVGEDGSYNLSNIRERSSEKSAK